MINPAVWGAGGANGGGSAVVVGSNDIDNGSVLSADGSAVPDNLIVGQGGADGGGEAEVG